MKHAIRRDLRCLLAGLLALAAACSGDATSPPGEVPAGLPAGIYPLVTLTASGAGAARADLSLERVQVPARVAGYQGEITYDTGVLTLQAVQLPAGIVGSTHQSAPGRIHFSGAAAQGVDDGPVLTLVFQRRGRVDRGAFTVTLEEVTAEDFGDLTPLASSGTPYLATR
ncbi:MAG TPA: hypothetical protein VFR37_00735 [Longimicrobium sp.]|nr:hypothetical protein [Longimicrobium sp.]